MTRSESREQAFLLVFEAQFCTYSTEKIIELAEEARGVKFTQYTKDLLEAATINDEEIEFVVGMFSENWSFDRISKVASAVLQLAIGELIMYGKEVPVGVVINEAVELCKKYGTEDEYAFVNGILGSYAKLLEETAAMGY